MVEPTTRPSLMLRLRDVRDQLAEGTGIRRHRLRSVVGIRHAVSGLLKVRLHGGILLLQFRGEGILRL